MPTVDGNLNDWTSSARLNPAGTTTAGYSLYGDLSGGVLTFALQAPTGTSIGTYTTLWLNTISGRLFVDKHAAQCKL